MRNTDENIRKILEKINNTPTPVSDGNGKLELEFSDTEGLVFFEGEPPAPEENRVKDTPKSFESPLDISEEFSLPESFVVNEKYDTPASPDVTSRIRTTYVPRFTEVSETYRMAGDTRPRPAREEKPRPKIEASDKPAERDEALDPTAELETAAPTAVIIERDNPTPEEDTESLNIFKFSDGEESAVPEKTEEELAREEIIRLIPSAAVADEPTVSEPEPTPEPAREEEPVESYEYVMPDPASAVRVYEVSGGEPLFTAPDGVEDAPVGKSRGEFTHPTQRDGIKDSFLDSLMSERVRMISAAILSLLMLVFENLWLFGVDLAALLHIEMLPGALAIIDAAFAAALFLLSIPETVRAVRALARGKALPELILPIGLAVLSGYAVTLALVPTHTYSLFGFIYAVTATSAIVASYFRTSADFTAFKLVSKNAEKRIIDNKLTRTLPEENIALDGAVDEYRSRTARIFRAAFITDFFKRITKCSYKSSTTVLAISVSLGTALVAGAVAFFLPGGSIISAMTAFTVTSLLGAPSALLFVGRMPYFDAQRTALSEDSTVVGEAAYHEYSDLDVIAFEDTEIFGRDDVNLKRFMLYGDRDNMEKVMRQMSSLFASVGGPLEYIFQNALDKRSHPASATVVETDGISGEVDGVRIYAGTEEYMLRHDVKIPDGAARPEQGGTGTTKVMYAAEGGEVYAKFYIRYSFSEEFTMLLPELRERGIVPLIYTRDPNVSGELLLTLTAGQDSIRVMKRLAAGNEETPIFRRVSTGIVTYGDKTNAINVVLLTKKYKRLALALDRLAGYAIGVGTLLGAVMSFALSAPIPSVALALWQIGLSVALRIASGRIFRKDKDK